MAELKSGDVVRHQPTGEMWLVIGVDSRPDRMHVYPGGWPPSRAKIEDCELIEHGPPLTDEERLSRRNQWPGVMFDDETEASR